MKKSCLEVIDALNKKVVEKEEIILKQKKELARFKQLVELIEVDLKNIENVVCKYERW